MAPEIVSDSFPVPTPSVSLREKLKATLQEGMVVEGTVRMASEGQQVTVGASQVVAKDWAVLIDSKL